MPTKPERVLVDTSVAVAVLVADHASHRIALMALADVRPGLSGHAWFETYSVLTRLPPPARRPAEAVTRALAHGFPETLWLDEDATADVAARLADLGVAGGAVYDALVGATAASHGLPLLTLDRRALPTYRAGRCHGAPAR